MLFILTLLLNFLRANDIILVPREGSDKSPNDICPANCKRPVFVTPYNINHLVKLLRENCIDEAAVAGKDCTPGNFVVNKHGRVTCYGRHNSRIRWAFCYADYKCPPKPCRRPYPCRPYPRRPYPCRPYPCRPYPCRPYPFKPFPCPIYPPRPFPCPPYPCYPPRPYPCPPYPCPIYPPRPFPCPPYPCYPPYPKTSPCYNPCAPKCPTVNFNKACVDPCGRVSSAVQGSFSAIVPPRYPGYFPGTY